LVIAQGDIWWTEMPEPVGSGPGFSRPAVVVQGDRFNRSRLATVVVIPLTSNTRLGDMPGNVLLPARSTALPQDSGANVTQIIALDRSLLVERVGKLSDVQLDAILAGLDVLFDR
jgi:mRNA interferase MazF